MMHGDTIFPVILAVPREERSLSGRAKAAFLSGHARRALDFSARKSGLGLGNLLKTANGAPQPSGGSYWSLTHKSAYAGGVVAAWPIGMDIERIRPIRNALYRRVASEQEWRLSTQDRAVLFFRYWTAKEAVLKAAAIGLKDLSSCRIVKVVSEHRLIIEYQHRLWGVMQVFFDGHIAAVVDADRPVEWTLIREDGRQCSI